MSRELSVQIAENTGPDGGVMVVTGLRAGHMPAVAAALYAFTKAERARFTDGTSGVGHAAEEFLAVLNKERGF